MDGLHEDLNRILQKPATQKPELKDDTVNDEVIEMLAEESWKTYKLRNESVILDLFGGLYLSTIVCPECKLTSVTFDPFMDLTLPLPSSQIWSKDVFVFPKSGQPCLLSVELSPSSTGDHLKEYVAKKLNVQIEALHMAEIYQTAFYRNIERLGSVTEISSDANEDILAIYEADFPLTKPDQQEEEEEYVDIKVDDKNDKNFLVPVYFQNVNDVGSLVRPIGVPFYISVSASEASDADKIAQKVKAKCAQLKTPSNIENEEEEEKVEPKFTMSVCSGNGDVPACDWRIYSSRLQPLLPPVIEILPENDTENLDVDSERSSMVNETGEEERPGTTIVTPNIDSDLHDTTHIVGDDAVQVDAEQVDATATEETPYDMPVSPLLNSPMPPSPVMSDDDSDNKFEGFGPFLDDNTNNNLVSPMGPPPVYTPTRPDGQLIGESDVLICNWDLADYEQYFGSEDISLTITHHPDPELQEIRRRREEKAAQGITLDDCLDTFSKAEVLSEADAWYCSRCKTHRRAAKTIELWKIPDIFTIHLKRFSSYHGFRDKLADVVQFPITGLDMSKRIRKSVSETIEKDGLLYDLFAVDNHYGGLGGGHYTAYVKNYVDDKWYYFDDSRVTEADPEDSITGAAYLLFYRRRSETPLGGQDLQEILKQIEEGREENEDIFDIEVEEGPAAAAAAPLFQGQGRVLGTSTGHSSSSNGSLPWDTVKLNLSDAEASEDEQGTKEMEFSFYDGGSESGNSDISNI